MLTHLEPEIAAPRAAIGKGIKTMLQEWTQARNGSLPRYDIISTSGPEHERIYECAVRIDGERLRGGVAPVGALQRRRRQRRQLICSA